MILTITPNTGLDHVLRLPELRFGERNQVNEPLLCMGGKGCDVSLVLRELGEETVATGFAAGENGRRMEAMLRSAGVVVDFVWTAGETRLNSVILETGTGRHTTITAEGLQPCRQSYAALEAWIRRWAASAGAVVLAGSLPLRGEGGSYRTLVEAALSGGAPVIVDAGGDALRQALDAGVWGVKPNLVELEAMVGRLETRAEQIAAAAELARSGAAWALVTLGAEGALLAGPSGLWFSPAVPVEVCSPAGAGDAAAACLALGAARGWDGETILREAVAAAADAVTHAGTAEVCREGIAAARDKVVIHRIA